MKIIDSVMIEQKETCYFCKEEFTEEGRGSFHVIINGKMVRAHKDCYKKWVAAGKTNVRVVIK